ncbi:hypothetical protein AnigIFM63604_011689 [Aspergillus niger]|nr:hypothetical protein M752DRAFT_115133 [Aspergillus phoenicis ATCC 13157]GLA30757.1 hypothetical protein AnigIFM63326_009191 [Aspergillus niger]GLA54159.1 hypothetical protein AnigIFM63604_011689 [Aspergillus niger]
MFDNLEELQTDKPKLKQHSSNSIYLTFRKQKPPHISLKMKLVSLVLAALAATTVQAAALQRWCVLPGQPCNMIKRAADASGEVKRSADALAEAIADATPETLQRWCVLPGQPCNKIKRAVEAGSEVKRSADAFAEAMADIDESDFQ